VYQSLEITDHIACTLRARNNIGRGVHSVLTVKQLASLKELRGGGGRLGSVTNVITARNQEEEHLLARKQRKAIS